MHKNENIFGRTCLALYLQVLNFGQYMVCIRFEDILHSIQFSERENKDTQIQDFLAAVNNNLITAITPGLYGVADESMIKLFHWVERQDQNQAKAKAHRK